MSTRRRPAPPAPSPARLKAMVRQVYRLVDEPSSDITPGSDFFGLLKRSLPPTDYARAAAGLTARLAARKTERSRLVSIGYENTAQELKRRILALIPDNPAILDMAEPWDLFRVPGFKCDDIGPSLAQACGALAAARAEWRAAGKAPRP